ncbi:MAG: glutamate racemase [Acidobacteriota bacterium]
MHPVGPRDLTSLVEHRQRPIGVFDSGIGGLTVAAALRRRLPMESIVYLGDTARLPYGNKSPETVRRYTRRNVDFLLDRGVKAVVVACNTASALALDELHPEVPIWGVIGPGARRAAETSGGRVAVIATRATVLSGAYQRALEAERSDLAIESRACPLFVPLVEEGWHDDAITEEVARRYLAPLFDWGADTLVLGCTHYPLLRPVLARVAGPEVTLVDSADAVADAVAEGLATADLLTEMTEPFLELCVTDGDEAFRNFAGRILDQPRPPMEWVDVTEFGLPEGVR